MIIAAASMIVLLAIGAIVIDLGFSWMLRRQEQNAADAAALAAARWIGPPDSVTKFQPYDAQGDKAACWYAIQNAIFESTNADCDPSLDPDGASIVVNYPPDSTAGRFGGQNGVVQVIISKQHDTFFSRIFGMDKATVTTQAVASRQEGNANTHSLIALDPHGCPSANIHGNAFIHIYPASGVVDPGGYVHVESDCGTALNGNDACSNGTGALKIDGTNANLFAPKTNVVGSCQTTQADEPHGLLDEAASPLGSDPLSGLRFPKPTASTPGETCGPAGPQTAATGSSAKGCGNNPMNWDSDPCPDDPATTEDESDVDCVILEPGVYFGGWKIGTNLRVILNPGIYTIAGGGITIGATGSLQSVIGGGGPAPVLIFNTDNPARAGCPINNDAGCQQRLDLTAGASLALAGLLDNAPCSPVTSPTATDCPFAGLVIWYDGEGSQSAAHSGLITVSGGVELEISGTIYAPTAKVELSGNSSTNTVAAECPMGSSHVAAVQIIAWQWDIGGTGDLCMPYDPSKLLKLQSQGLVH